MSLHARSGRAGAGKCEGSAPIVESERSSSCGERRGCDDRDQGDRYPRTQPDAAENDRDDGCGHQHGLPVRAGQPLSNRADCDADYLLTVGFNAERRRHLLQRDDDGDAEGEALDHR